MANIEDDENTFQKQVRLVREELIRRWIHENLKVSKVARNARLNERTVKNFLNFRTRRPQSATLFSIADALGYRIVLIPKEAPQQPDEKKLRSHKKR